MPWTPGEFKSRHNHKLSGKQAKKASSIANAILRRGGDEGVAIATANKRARSLGKGPGALKTPPRRGKVSRAGLLGIGAPGK